jgi:UDP-arabinose 4-epimerase
MTTNENAHILVTGGAGYIGSHTCKALAAQGFIPVTFDNLSTGHASAVKWGPLLVGDVRNPSDLDAALAAYKSVAVLHFAASAYVGESVENPEKYYDNNVTGTQRLLAAMRKAGTKKLVFSSSCATYGVPAQMPITEQTVQNPINPYGRTKLICELMVKDHATAHGLQYALMRYFNAAGADPDGELVENHDPETHLIPRVLMAACRVIETIEIFGDDYSTGDGTCIRDYIHVSDLAAGHLKALEMLLKDSCSTAFNLGSGKGHSIREMIRTAEEVTGATIPVRYVARRPGDSPELVADANKAKTQLGFRTNFSDLRTIIATANRSVQTVYMS